MSSLKIVPPLAGRVLTVTGGGFAVAEWQDPGGDTEGPRFIAPWHLHRSDDEAWYVLEGVLRIRAGNDEVEIPAGSGYLVSRGTPHTYWNPSAGRTRYLLIMTARIYELIQAIHATADRNPASMKALFERYDSELLA